MTAHPPGEPPAEELAEQNADVQIMDGPRAGEIWTYDAARGGYLLADVDARGENDVPMTSIGALIEHAQCVVVRPVAS